MSDPLRAFTECIFCGSTEMTDEDFFPRWMSKALPREVFRGDGYYAYQLPRSVHDKKEFMDLWRKRRELYNSRVSGVVRGPAHSMKLRVACGSCNNGWMSSIENQVAGFLKAYIAKDKPRNPVYLRLSTSQWHCMARWVAMKATALLYANDFAMSKEELDEMSNGGIPRNVTIDYCPGIMCEDSYGTCGFVIPPSGVRREAAAIIGIKFSSQMLRFVYDAQIELRSYRGSLFPAFTVHPRTEVNIDVWASSIDINGWPGPFEHHMEELFDFVQDVNLIGRKDASAEQ